MIDIKKKIDEANAKAVKILVEGEPIWTGDKQLIDVVPDLKKNVILHAGPPIEWDRMANPMRNAILGAIVFEKLAGPSFFKPETNIDVFLDIVLALGAGWLVFKFLLN